jgi:hypothetical protein
VVDGDAGRVNGEGVERLGLDALEVLERREPDGDVGDVVARTDLRRDEPVDPVNRALG